MKKNLLAFVLIAALFASCGKDKETSTPTPTPTITSVDLFQIYDENGLFGFINIDGDTVINQQYLQVRDFYYDLAAVQVAPTPKWGYINKQGILISTMLFDEAYDFTKDGLAKVYIDGKWGYINKAGKEIITPIFVTMPGDFSEGLAYARQNNFKGYGFINTKGVEKIPVSYSHTLDFSEGYAAVENGSNLWGYIDTAASGTPKIDYQYYSARNFINGYAVVENDIAKFGVIDKKKNEILPFNYDSIGDYSENLFCFKLDKKYGYINNTKTVVITAEFDNAKNFSEGLAAVQKGNYWGYINKTGSAINPQFREASNFKNGLAWVKFLEDTYGYINKAGERVWESAK